MTETVIITTPSSSSSPTDASSVAAATVLAAATSSSSSSSSSMTQSLSILNNARRLLYISHFVAQFSERAWFFAIVLFLSALTDYQSMIFVSTYGICTNGAVFIFGSKAGQYVDISTNRLRTARIFIWTENICVIVASICCYLLLCIKVDVDGTPTSTTTVLVFSETYPIVLLIGIHILGPIAQILDGGFLVAMERDWVVVMGSVAQRLLVELQHHTMEAGVLVDDDQTEKVRNDGRTTAWNGNDDRCQNDNDNDDDDDTTTVVSSDNYPTTNEEPQQQPQQQEQPKNPWLIQTNVTMKQIDLICQVTAPAIAGLFIDQFGTNNNNKEQQLPMAAIIVSIVNVISLLVEYYCTMYIYHLVPELSYNNNNNNKSTSTNNHKIQAVDTVSSCTTEAKCTNVAGMDVVAFNNNNNNNNNNNDSGIETATTKDDHEHHHQGTPLIGNEEMMMLGNTKYNSISDDRTKLLIHYDDDDDDDEKPSLGRGSSSMMWYAKTTVASYGYKWIGIYFQQPVWYAGFGLALLYFNALTFGGLMMNYLLYRGMSMGQVGIWRGISSAIGLLGTIAYKVSVNRTTLSNTGMWSVLYQLSFISLSFVSMFITNYRISMGLLILGVCTSRIGLYVYEITVTQLMQHYIPEPIRGTIGGIQISFNAFFQLSSFIVCVVYPNPNDFIIVVTIGYIAVATAVILYGYGIYQHKSQFG